MKKTEAQKRKEFESREVFKRQELGRLNTTGYEAFRVSPRTTTKYGKKYRKLYGASVEPDWNRGTKGAYGAKITWWQHAYTSEKVKPGTRLLQNLTNYPIDKKEANRKLMIKKRKR